MVGSTNNLNNISYSNINNSLSILEDESDNNSLCENITSDKIFTKFGNGNDLS